MIFNFHVTQNQIDPIPLRAKWKLIFMEYLEDYQSIEELLEKPIATELSQAIEAKLQSCIGILKEKLLVHGDIRPPNIMVKIQEGKLQDLKLVDFDWFGREKEVFYPSFLNDNITWPRGVSDFKPILTSHDAENVAMVISYLKNPSSYTKL